LYHHGHAIVHLVGAPKPLTPDDALGHVAFNFEDLRPQTERPSAMGHVCIPQQVPETDICQFFMRVEGEVWGEETIRIVLL
jgi:hypothetical protein